MDAGDALDQGALAGAVVTDEGGDLPEGDVQVDAPQDVDGTEALVDVAELEQRLDPAGGGSWGVLFSDRHSYLAPVDVVDR